MSKKGLMLAALIIIIILAVFALVWYRHPFHPSTNSQTGTASSTIVPESSTTTSSLASISWDTYISTSSDFSIQYPASWYVQESSGIDASTSFEISPEPPLPPGEVDMRKGYAYVSIEPGSCEIFYATDFLGSQVSNVSINALPMVKIHTAILNNTSSPEDSGRFDLYLFSGDVHFGWANDCNTIRLYAPGIDGSVAASSNGTDTQEIAQTEAIEDYMIQSFMFSKEVP